MPEILHQTKNHPLFESYRLNAKNWINKRTYSLERENNSKMDMILSQKWNMGENIKVMYNGWKSDYVSVKDIELITDLTRKSKNTDVTR